MQHRNGSRFQRASRIALLIAATSVASLSASPPAARAVGVGRIIGNIDGISRDGEQFFIAGWACQQGQKQSIAVRVFADASRSTLLTAGMANLASEPAIAQACQDSARGQHRFFIVLPIGHHGGGTVDVEGFVIGGIEKAMLAGSGQRLVQHGAPVAPFPSPPPPKLAGTYHALAEHPRVLMTATELRDAAWRSNRPGSYSKERFGQLVDKVTHDLASGIDWDATYSGCIVDIYQYAFSFEPQNGKDATIRAALALEPGAKTPAGGAIVASRLALYAALVKAGALAPAGAPSAEQAVALAKRILLAWADHGFPRDSQGRLLSLPALSCEENGKISLLGAAGPALALARGIIYSVHAQDLLQSLGALDAKEEGQLNVFHAAMFDIIRHSDNVKFGYGGIPFPAPPIARYNNVDAGALTSLLAIARLLGDARKFNAALYGEDHSVPVVLPWWRFFDRAIYGESDSPLACTVSTIECSPNKDPGNYPYFQTPNVAPGEVVDRHRNEHAANSFGYAVGTVRSLINAAEILRIAGFDPYGYRGAHQQSIEMAIDYYACFAKGDGFYKLVTPERSGSCPNAGQYYGKLINDVDRLVVFGAYRFPKDKAITELDAAARTASSKLLLDPLAFGRWRD